eukprot:GHUV01005838.1.p1 GENE.GHUV01005838.1~~GHUV01005838.1.p1  ORF type:complete len:378 (+),score=61.98 GHUV01005838.1:268-1401(+)
MQRTYHCRQPVGLSLCCNPLLRPGAHHPSALQQHYGRPQQQWGTAAAATTQSAAAGPGQPQSYVASGKETEKLPLQQRILNGILNVSNVPYSSFVPHPVTPLHRVDAQIKQLWLLLLYVVIARATPLLRLGVAGGVATLTMICLPRRLWISQLKRLGFICGLIFVFTAIGSDSVPPLLQQHSVPGSVEGLNVRLTPDTPYSYVILNLGIMTITRRSINLAVTAAALTFCALQSASLCLVTTPGEEMALGLSRWLAPLKPLGVPTQRIALTLLLSLRFMSLVFEEVRNLCLGLAARGVNWRAQGARGSLEILSRLVVRLFGNLFQRSEKISQAMVVRGFLGPEQHHLYLMRCNETSWLANVVALLLLGGLCAAVTYIK